MEQILLMFAVLSTQDSKTEDLFCGAPSGSDSSLFSKFRSLMNMIYWHRLVLAHRFHHLKQEGHKAPNRSPEKKRSN